MACIATMRPRPRPAHPATVVLAAAVAVAVLLPGAVSDAAIAVPAHAFADPLPPPPTGLLHSLCPRCGEAMRAEFFFPPNFTNINHGGFGAVPRPVAANVTELVATAEANIEGWINGATGYKPRVTAAIARLAAYVNAQPADVVLVENSSGAVNAVLRSLRWQPGDILVDLSTAYLPFKMFYDWLASTHGAVIREVPIQVPVPDAATVVATLDTFLQQLDPAQVRAVIVSHVSSYPSFVYPVKEIVQVCRKHKLANIIIDGAHALGAIDIDLEDMAPDYYFSDAHKWLFGAKGTAFLWANPAHQADLVPTVVDSFNETFSARFLYTGTRDYTPFASLQASFDFRERCCGGDRAIKGYSATLVQWAGRYLAARFNTSQLAPPALQGTMTNVVIPTSNTTVCGQVSSAMLHRFSTYVSGPGQVGNIACFFRVSASIYNSPNDYVVMADRILQLLAELEA